MLAQLGFLDFAHGVARQFLDHPDALGNLEFRKLVLGAFDDFIGVGLTAICRHDDTGNGFAKVGMGQAEDCDFFDFVIFGDDFFDFLRIDVEAARNDQVLVTTDNGDIAVFANGGEVTGDKEAIGAEFGCGFSGICQ